MTTLVLVAFVFFYVIFVGAELQSIETESLEHECSRVEVFKEDVDSRIGRLFYFPVWIYAVAVDYFCRRERASE